LARVLVYNTVGKNASVFLNFFKKVF
jgi:hypothetical protein